MKTAPHNRPLELSGGQMRQMVDLAMSRILPHLESLSAQPAQNTAGGDALSRSLIEPLPRDGESFEELLTLLFDRLIPKTYNTAGPGYLAYIPGGGLFHAAVADLISNAVNRYVGVWAAAPALAQLEANVVRWFCEIVGFPAEGRGFLSSGGSIANFSAVVTARCDKLSENFLKGTVYASDQVHHSVLKAAHLAGIPLRNVRCVPSNSRYQIDLDVLLDQLDQDISNGFDPFLLVGSGGTTNTGAVDDLDGLADIAQSKNLWFHVDAAYGGFFRLTDRGRARLVGIERADSLVLDPHKGLFLPYGTGSLLVRNGAALRRAHSIHGEYMPAMQEDPDFIDFCEISPELSRGFRGLRAWLPLKMHGIEPFRACLEEKLDLAATAVEELRRMPGIEIVAEPQLSILAFRIGDRSGSLDQQNTWTRELRDRVNAKGRVYLTSTVLRGMFVIRVCVLSFRTHQDRIEAALEDIRSSLAAILAQD